MWQVRQSLRSARSAFLATLGQLPVQELSGRFLAPCLVSAAWHLDGSGLLVRAQLAFHRPIRALCHLRAPGNAGAIASSADTSALCRPDAVPHAEGRHSWPTAARS